MIRKFKPNLFKKYRQQIPAPYRNQPSNSSCESENYGNSGNKYKSYTDGHSILRIFETLPFFLFTTNETNGDY